MEIEEARKRELIAFDDTKAGVRGLVVAGVQTIPSIFNCKQFGFNDNNPPPNHLQQLHIPIIDLEFVGSSSNKHYRDEVVERVRDACREWGFFQIINHGIPVSVLDDVIRGIRLFHEQDEDLKKALYSRDSVNNKVLYQSNFDLFNAPSANWRDTLAWVIPPSAEQEEEDDDLPSVCRQALSAYMKEVKQLGQTLFELLSEALGLKPEHLLEMECAETLMILGHYYPPCPQPELAIGTTSHCDSDFLTVLLQDQIGGLQILHQNQWVDVAPMHGALIVNIGDLLQLVSNDTFISANHRVLSKKEGPRISVASFFRAQVSAQKRYGPIAELISEATPPIYRQIALKEYMDNYYGKGLDGTSALQPFKLF